VGEESGRERREKEGREDRKGRENWALVVGG